MTLRTKLFGSAVGAVALLGGFVGLSSLAAAAEVPTITAVVQNSSNANISSALVGSSVHAMVTVASSTATTSPTGTVDFNLYSNLTCSGSALTQTGVALASGTAVSNATTLGASGLSYIVNYSGDGNLYNPGNSGCVSVSASQSAPTLSLSLSNTNVQAGSFVYAIPTLSNASSTAGGSVAFNIYSDNACSNLALAAGSKTVTNASVPNSDTYQFITPGTYYWQAIYSGDAGNAAATSTCGSAVLTVTATSSAPSISTSLSNSSVVAGSSVYDTSTLNNESANAGGSVSYKVYNNNACTTGALDAGTMTVNNGSVPNSNSLVFNTPGTYYWQAAYSGDANNTAATSSCGSEILTVSATTTTPTGGPGTISGNVFNDLNKNDVKDGSDVGLAGWTIWLHEAATSSSHTASWFKSHDAYNDPIVATATTDANGNYSFTNLGNGQYFVEQSVMSGWKQDTDDVKVTLTGSNTSGTVNFADVQKATTTNNGGGNGNGNGNNGNGNGNNGNGNGNNGNGNNGNQGNWWGGIWGRFGHWF